LSFLGGYAAYNTVFGVEGKTRRKRGVYLKDICKAIQFWGKTHRSINLAHRSISVTWIAQVRRRLLLY
jgi:hypothetical protein